MATHEAHRPAMEVSVAEGGLQKVTLRAAGKSEVEIYSFGAHIVSWRAADGVNRIYTSPTAIYNGIKAIRGGIPVCFPQFGPRGPLKQHGFARTSTWTLDSSFGNAATPAVRFILRDNESTRTSGWPHLFEMRFTVQLAGDGNTLTVDMAVDNLQATPFTFTCALHSYFTCLSQEVALQDFSRVSYLDSADYLKEKMQDGDITFGKEVDRIYISTVDTISLKNSDLTICKTNLPEAVVWNPYIQKAAALSDMPDDDWKNFICIEPARIIVPAEVSPGKPWEASLVLKVD